MAERRASAHARLAGWEWALVAAILLGAFTLRVAAFQAAPPGVIHDEVRNWLNAQLILGGDIRPLYPYGGGREALYLFIQAAAFRLVGDNLLAARLPSIAFSLVGMSAGFALSRRLFGRAAGLVTLAGMAASFWSVLFARLAVRTGSMPALALLTAYLYVRLLMNSSLHKPRWAGFLVAGVALAATLYTYPSALIFPAILLAWIGGLALARPAWLRGRWLPLLASFVLAFALAIPLLRAWADPATTARANEVDAPLTALLGGDPGPTLANVEPVLLMFSVRGDPGLEFNVENQPVFPTVPLAALFYLGLIGALVGLARRWRGVGWLIAILAASSLLIELAHTVGGYFVTWAQNPVVEFLYQENYQAIARDLDAGDSSTAVAVGGLTPDEMDPVSMRLLMADDERAAALGFFDPQTALLIPPAAGAPRQVVVPQVITLHPALESALESASVEESFPAYTRYTLSNGSFESPPDRLATFADPAGAPLVDLAGVQVVGSPGERAFTLITRWEAHQPSPERLRIFVHLIGPDGAILAQSDVLGVPATQWRPGDTILQAHDLALPAGSSGPYGLAIGLYRPETGIRMAISTPPGGDAFHLDLPSR
ncbi:MAG: glycosyltransferase family 39 protein [Chloroflexota bacterium]